MQYNTGFCSGLMRLTSLLLFCGITWVLTGLPSYADPTIWVGMFPVGYSENSMLEGQPFNVYTQVYKLGVTEPMGPGAGLECTLVWGEVSAYGGKWETLLEIPMTYNGDIGNNDEYRVVMEPTEGLYEFTTRCTDLDTSTIVWQKGGNSRLSVRSMPSERRAIWVDRTTIAWNSFGAATYELHHDPDGTLRIPPRRGSGITLQQGPSIGVGSYPKFPNLTGYDSLKLPALARSQVPELVRGELAIAAYDRAGNLIDATGVQLQGVLDDLFTYTGELGVIYSEDVPTLKVWAPTAKSVDLYRYSDPNPSTGPIITPMAFDQRTGVWSITGDPSWTNQYYLYDVDVYTPFTGKIETNVVTDPYSISLSMDSQRSQIVDLYNDPTLKPDGWDELQKPPFTVPEDMAIYEVHVRDFSRDDQSVPPQYRGKFKAFTYDGFNDRPLSQGMSHLKQLAEAGLTHVHLMPAFDFVSVNEDPIRRSDPDSNTLSNFPRNSSLQQAIVGITRGNDSFNWGFDPWHYGVPEGSYATDPNGSTRILEFREMVQSLNNIGLRTVMGVVYNHMFANNRYSQAALDKVVPGYYHRYTNEGYQHNTSCCPDTASEFNMMEKLLIDTVIRWSTAYKVDGFRFDLMNLHTVENMTKLRDQVQALTLEKDGVDGSSIYLYGEGWDFGSARDRALKYANQYNMAGTGIGTFNDKLRDAAHGGASTDPTDTHQQGFINGVSYDWNGFFYGRRFKRDLRYAMDRIRIALAGSLASFTLIDQDNQRVSGIQFNGTGYTQDPQETINYVSKHDNETLFDLNVLKMPMGERGAAITPMTERVRAQNLGISLVGLSQGIPFFQLGVDMLRSKSLDRNSYDSGDWFNRIDYTYHQNYFGSGLPPAWSNLGRWGVMDPLLANYDLNPSRADILSSVAHLRETLRIRRSSKLFRLETADDIKQRIQFYNLGSNQRDALIIMSITDRIDPDLDPNYEDVVVLINANKVPQQLDIGAFIGIPLELHPVQQQSSDPIVKQASFDSAQGTFLIPPRTTAVFVSP